MDLSLVLLAAAGLVLTAVVAAEMVLHRSHK